MSTVTQLTESIAQTEIKEEKQEIEIKTKEENEEDKPIDILLDKDQNKSEKYDPDWKYNITLGNIAKYKVPSITNKDEDAEYWFAMDDCVYDAIVQDQDSGTDDTSNAKKKKRKTPRRKVFVSGKVKRLSDIDANEETFRCKFHLYMNWYITKAEYLNYLQHKNNNSLSEFKPNWYPLLEMQNCIQKDEFEWEEYPNEGQFRVQKLKKFGSNLSWKLDDDISQNSMFCRAKLEVSGVFSEELELQNFPFDCQPLNIYIHERTVGDKTCIFLPELRKSSFFSLDPRFSVYSEWSLYLMKLTFGDAHRNEPRMSTNSYGTINLKIVLKREWKIYIYRSFVVIGVIDLLGLCGFVIFDSTERLNMLLSLLLTIVVAMQESLNEPYMTFLGRYSLSGFIFLVLLTAQATFYDYYDSEIDTIFLVCFSALFVIMQLIWCCLAYYARKDEILRCAYDQDEEEQENSMMKPSLKTDWTKWFREGHTDRLLSFISTPQYSDYMDEKTKEQLLKEYQMQQKIFAR